MSIEPVQHYRHANQQQHQWVARMQRWLNRCNQIVKTTVTNLPVEKVAPLMRAIFLPMIRFTGQLRPLYCAFRQFIPPVVIRFPLAKKRWQLNMWKTWSLMIFNSWSFMMKKQVTSWNTAFSSPKTIDTEKSPIDYLAFREGTVIPERQSTEGASGHRNTWRIAYTISLIREWIFRQSR